MQNDLVLVEMYLTLATRRAKGLEPPVVDTAAVLNSAEAMKAFLMGTFEFCEEVVRNWSEEDRKAPDPLPRVEVVAPKAELLDQAYLHTAYTLGQVVANFRKHGMAPPAFPPVLSPAATWMRLTAVLLCFPTEDRRCWESA